MADDIKITQDVKILYQLMTAFKDANPEAGLNLLNIGSIHVHPSAVPPDPSPITPGRKPLSLSVPNNLLGYTTPEIEDAVSRVLDLLPEPRWENLMFHVLRYAYDKEGGYGSTARYLGIGRTTAQNWLKKMGIMKGRG